MSVPLDAVGRELEPHHTYVDARWTMSYAAVRPAPPPLSHPPTRCLTDPDCVHGWTIRGSPAHSLLPDLHG